MKSQDSEKGKIQPCFNKYYFYHYIDVLDIYSLLNICLSLLPYQICEFQQKPYPATTNLVKNISSLPFLRISSFFKKIGSFVFKGIDQSFKNYKIKPFSSEQSYFHLKLFRSVLSKLIICRSLLQQPVICVRYTSFFRLNNQPFIKVLFIQFIRQDIYFIIEHVCTLYFLKMSVQCTLYLLTMSVQ